MQAGYLNGPGVEGIAPVLSWTAPASGYYTIDGSWVVANQTGGGASLAIVDNGGLTYDRYAAAMGSTNPFTYTKYYTAGTVIQFQVGSDFKTGAPVGLDADIKTTGSSSSAYFVNTGMSATEAGTVTGPGGLTKSGSGTLTLSANNTFSGALGVQAGALNLNTTGGSAAGSISSLSVASGATLLVSQSNQVNNTASVTLSGGTISRATGVSETFGALDLTGASTLDFGSGTAGTLTFGTYEGGGTPSAILTLNNFFGGNSLVLGSALSSYLTPGTYSTTSFSNSYFVINSVSGGFTASESGGTFTITAIPEPSTYLAAAGLLALMIAPLGRRALSRTKSVG
jgi:autotransporter-associated beta strand protein